MIFNKLGSIESLVERLVRTLAHARKRIIELTGIERSNEQVRQFLRRNGFKPLKVGSMPAKVDTEAHADFKKQLDPRLDQADRGERTIYFVDASHFVYGGVLGVLWTAIRMLIPTGSGCQRLNVLGAIAYGTCQLHSVINTGSIVTEQVCELFRKLRTAHRKPITVVLENARYQRNNAVLSLADSLGIELLFLPACSANLNLIERVWKFVKAEALAARVLPDFTSFRSSIESTLSELSTTHRGEMKTLVTGNSIASAGLIPWQKPLVNLRASCRTDLEERFLSHVVDGWQVPQLGDNLDWGNQEITIRIVSKGQNYWESPRLRGCRFNPK